MLEGHFQPFTLAQQLPVVVAQFFFPDYPSLDFSASSASALAGVKLFFRIMVGHKNMRSSGV